MEMVIMNGRKEFMTALTIFKDKLIEHNEYLKKVDIHLVTWF